MKLNILNTKNAQNGSITFPVQEEVREDLIKRAVHALASRMRQPYGADPRAGLKHSTRVSRRRRNFRGSYGQGISRVPRKVMMRRGRHHYWTGAEAPGTVGGRRAHPPKVSKIWEQKLNKKENRKAINSAMVAALTPDLVSKRGHIVPQSYPFALDTDFDALAKTKDVLAVLETLGFADELARGKNGGKSLLIVTENEQFARAARNIPGVDVASATQLNAYLLAPGAHPGRATLFSVSSIKQLAGEETEEKTVPAQKAPAKKAAVKKAPAKKAAKEATA